MPDCASIHDRFGRRVDYLRMSVTDRCNERCLYCMPQGYRGCGTDALGIEDFVRIVATAVSLESVAELTDCLPAFPFAETEVVSLQAARDRKAGSYHLMSGQNPIYIFTMQGGGETA